MSPDPKPVEKYRMNLIEFPSFVDPNGMLTVFEEGTNVPFVIRRVFAVTAEKGAKRGEHAHRRCSQLVVCISGSIRLSCFDGDSAEEVVMSNDGRGALILPGTWATQEYLQSGSTIMVLCDRAFEAEDYIRDYQEFLDMKAAKR